MKFCTLSGVKIGGITACVPQNKMDNRITGTGIFGPRLDDVIKAIGIKERRICRPGTTALDLSVAAGRQLIDTVVMSPTDIGGLIFVTQTPDYDIPNNSSRAAHLLDLPKDCAAVDTSFGCSGYVYGLWLAGLMAKSLRSPILLLDGETHSLLTSPRDRATALLFGDAGSATLVLPDEEATPWHFGFLTDGSKYDILIIPEGRSRQPFNERSLEYREWPDGGVRRPIDIRMDGMAVFDFVVRNVPGCLKALLSDASCSASAVDLLLLHQANLFMIQQTAKLLNVPPERMPVSLDRYGNSSSVTIPVTICSEVAQQVTGRTNRALLAGFGAGLSIAAALIDLGPCICPPLIEYGEDAMA